MELLLYEAENVIAKIQVKIHKKNPEKSERKYAELERQHSHFQRQLHQRHRKKWKRVEERDTKKMREKNFLEATGTNSSSLIMQSKLTNKT